MILTLIILGIIIGGFLSLLSIVFLIMSIVKSKNKNTVIWVVVFVFALGLCIYSTLEFMERAADKMESGFEWLKENGKDVSINTINNDDEGQKKLRQNWLDTLQVYNLDKYDGKVPADFYVNKPAAKDAKGFMIVPFIYPYSINYNSVTNTGDLLMEGTDSIFVNNISQVAFDNNFAIIKVDNSQSPIKDHAATEFLLYDMRTRNYEPAPNMEKLLDLGNRIGYIGSKQLNNLSDDYKGWIK
jgi:hypothetical protein